ncbi:MAG: replication initiator protein [Microvirus sp.]|nr:MAG: replication initiator protein [Microvirus sp.]
MPCYRPISAYRCSNGDVVFAQLKRHDIVRSIDIPCGQCQGCRLARSSEWASRIMHEASLHKSNSFLTLTYSDSNLPLNNSLHYPDFQSFMKRFRRFIHPTPVRFYMCGEYGSTTLRPHYHACIFGYQFPDLGLYKSTDSGHFIYTSPSLNKLWPLGHASIGELTPQSAAYTARYVMKKVTGQAAQSHYTHIDADGVIHEIQPEFCRMSLKPGVGARWFDKFHRDMYPHDYLVNSKGAKVPIPAYYDKLLKRKDPDTLEQIKQSRELTGREFSSNNTTERLAVRETVQAAKIRNLKRSL